MISLLLSLAMDLRGLGVKKKKMCPRIRRLWSIGEGLFLTPVQAWATQGSWNGSQKIDSFWECVWEEVIIQRKLNITGVNENRKRTTHGMLFGWHFFWLSSDVSSKCRRKVIYQGNFSHSHHFHPFSLLWNESLPYTRLIHKRRILHWTADSTLLPPTLLVTRQHETFCNVNHFGREATVLLSKVVLQISRTQTIYYFAVILATTL